MASVTAAVLVSVEVSRIAVVLERVEDWVIAEVSVAARIELAIAAWAVARLIVVHSAASVVATREAV